MPCLTLSKVGVHSAASNLFDMLIELAAHAVGVPFVSRTTPC